MVHIASSLFLEADPALKPFTGQARDVGRTVLIIRDERKNNVAFDMICGFLDLTAEHAGSGDDLARLLRANRPVVVIADLDGERQDGCHVMMTVAGFDRTLPVLLVTDPDPSLLGAVDAIQEVWGLASVGFTSDPPDIGALVDFLCRAGRDAGMSRMLRIQ